MMRLMPRMAGRIFGRPLLVDEGKALDILAGIGARIVDGSIVIDGSGVPPAGHTAFQSGRLGVVGDRLGLAYDSFNAAPFDMIGGVAVIPVEGTLIHKGAFVGSQSGETSYQGLQTQIRRAAARSDVKGVVFEIDSFGGEASGAFETANEIAALSAIKPTLAILTDFALSAGYLLASAARQIVMPEFGEAGSIGAIIMHADLSRKLANEGVQITIISAGKYKADGHPALPLSEKLRADMQASTDAMREKFATAVSRYRGRRLSFDAAIATEADIFKGRDAKARGLVDGIGAPNDMFAAFVDAISRSS